MNGRRFIAEALGALLIAPAYASAVGYLARTITPSWEINYVLGLYAIVLPWGAWMASVCWRMERRS